MTSKRDLEKRLERLEAQREMKRTATERFDGEIGEAVVDAIIEFSSLRLSGASNAVVADAAASLPADVQAVFEAIDEGAASP
ncbi:hypothetical protein [Halalkalicoccus sp. NIPERK01]|uniref:hypothetical protein n=1 Tax=Halalkalicoccus sp. NIPERK01 TaxID=3053469 RepID=UPI00256F24D5|nr:hypothetical protein [Halalkalicoccus sp. NIPERK01]MDL5363412.1 hypothetical protein [Halalkalicoccus sp. NIPERK01]